MLAPIRASISRNRWVGAMFSTCGQVPWASVAIIWHIDSQGKLWAARTRNMRDNMYCMGLPQMSRFMNGSRMQVHGLLLSIRSVFYPSPVDRGEVFSSISWPTSAYITPVPSRCSLQPELKSQCGFKNVLIG